MGKNTEEICLKKASKKSTIHERMLDRIQEKLI